MRSELQVTVNFSALSESRNVSCFESLSLIFTTLSTPRSWRHFVNIRNGSTRTMNMGMKATTRTMTMIRATRATKRARGKIRMVTNAPQYEQVLPVQLNFRSRKKKLTILKIGLGIKQSVSSRSFRFPQKYMWEKSVHFQWLSSILTM